MIVWSVEFLMLSYRSRMRLHETFVCDGRQRDKALHHIRVTCEMKADLCMWMKFLGHPTVYARPFTDFSKSWNTTDIGLYTDTTKNPNLGFGGVCGTTAWMVHTWDPQFIVQNDPSIEYLELFAVTAAILAWIHQFENRENNFAL